MAESWYRIVYPSNADIIHFRHLLQPPDDREPLERFQTLWIDLSKPAGELLAGMNKTTRQLIRSAEKSGVRYEYFSSPGTELIEEFVRFYNEFAMVKKLPGLLPESLRLHAACGLLDISRTSDREGNPFVWHAHYRDSQFARLRHSASLFRKADAETAKIIGSANRLHHWLDFLRFQNEGIGTYDFGGLYDGSEDQERLRINQFKESFGGERRINYHCTRSLTLKGRLYLGLANWRNRSFARSAG